jgi:hypothetical protein
MTRKSIASLLLVAAACTSSTSCGLFFLDRDPAPPVDPDARAQWWSQRVDLVPTDFLVVYVEAADMHRRQATAATYVQDRGGHNMLGKVHCECRLPCPPPDVVLTRMREKAIAAAPSDRWDVTAEECRGCTPDEAMRIWRAAAEAVTNRHRGE